MMIRPLNTLLADAVRAVNASLDELEDPPDLRPIWKLTSDRLELAKAAGDEVAAQRIIRAYRTEALAVIERAQR